MAYNQLFDFLDNLDTSIHKHVVMFYEEPEYAKLVQLRFLDDGLESGECCVYAVKDNDDLIFTKTEMVEYGIDVDYYQKDGLLQFYMRKPSVSDIETYKRARTTFEEEIVNRYYRSQGHPASMVPRIRGVGSIYRDVFARIEGESSNEASVQESQLLVEKLFQDESSSAFDGVWMCAYQVNNICASFHEEWMARLLENHDAVLFLRKLSNGIALNLKK